MISYAESLIGDTSADLVTRIEAVVGSSTGTFKVYDPVSSLKLGKDLDPPFAAITYGGMRPIPDNHRQNRGQKVRFYVYVLAGKSPEALDIYPEEGEANTVTVNQLLDTLRNAIVGTQAPSRHKWSFEGEAPYDFGECGIGYVQIWEVSAIIGES